MNNTGNYLKLTILLLLLAFTYNTFLVPINLVSGGTGGLGIIFSKVFGIEPYLIIFLVSSLMFLLSRLFLDTKRAFATLYVICVYPIFIKLFSCEYFYSIFKNENILTLVFISAILYGIFQGLIFKLGFNIGGLSIIAQIFNKYFKCSITFVNTIINFIIVLLGSYVFGVLNLLYAIIFLIISREVSEKTLLGSSTNKTFKIISSKYKKIEEYINKNLHHDTTIYDTYGAYKLGKSKLIMSVIPNSDFIALTDYVKSVDRNAFIFVTDTYDAERQDYILKKKVLSQNK